MPQLSFGMRSSDDWKSIDARAEIVLYSCKARRWKMISIRRSNERGTTKTEWLDSRHTFSFGAYRDPAHIGFGALRVLNEDVIAAGNGFPPHPHSDMEIVTYLLSGVLQHRDSLGNGSTIRPGEIQRMSAGAGIVHAEFNASRENACHLLQIWIAPSKSGITPSYEQKAIDPVAISNKLARVAAPEPRENEVRLLQDAEIWAAKFDRDEEVIHPLAPGRRSWIQIAKGKVTVGGELLRQGDAAGITDQDQIRVRARSPAEVLLFDLA
jgi:redox-sensitive bicupin YhaK (pirin superfamily)